MDARLSQDYSVDSRYRGLERAQDDNTAKRFVKSFLQRKARADNPSVASELRQEDRFLVAGPGQSQYTFRNAFRASK